MPTLTVNGRRVTVNSDATLLDAARAAGAATIVATDVSDAALEVARRNAETHGVGERVRFLEGDLFEPLEPGARFDGANGYTGGPRNSP